MAKKKLEGIKSCPKCLETTFNYYSNDFGEKLECSSCGCIINIEPLNERMITTIEVTMKDVVNKHIIPSLDKKYAPIYKEIEDLKGTQKNHTWLLIGYGFLFFVQILVYFFKK